MINGFLIFLIKLSGSVISTFYFFKLISCFIPIKRGRAWSIGAYLGLCMVVPVIVYVEDPVNIFYTLIWFIFVMGAAYEGQWVKKISVVLVLYPIVVSANFFLRRLVWEAGDSYVLWCVLLILFWSSLSKFFGKRVDFARQYIEDSVWLLIDLVCVAPLVVIMLTLIWTDSANAYRAMIIAGTSLFSNIGILFLIEHLIRGVKVKMDNEKFRIREEYFNELQKEQERSKRIYHDMNNNLQVVAAQIQQGDFKRAQNYFQEVLEIAAAKDMKNFCRNNVVNAVLNSKYRSMVENDISLRENISLNEDICIEELDLCSIFANTLDNAIEASLKIADLQERYIIVNARLYNGSFFYHIKNRKVNKVIQEGENFYTDKDSKLNHGYGLKNVREIVEGYGGYIEITYNNEFFEIIITISNKID